ncbi:MAG: cation diffusion facilitator family transporter [Smithellaceae bacterium]
MSTHLHHHTDTQASWGRRLLTAIVINLLIPIVQIWGGIVSGSMALISDALHNLSDFISLVINYAALLIGRRAPTHKQTFGYKRVEIFAALISVAILYAAAVYIAIEAWQRFIAPRAISGQIVIWIALLGFAGNLFSALILHSGAKVNLNMKSAFLHMMADAATSLAVVALGVLWLFKPWYWLDPVLSWLIVALIIYSGWGILKDSFLILMNATPPGINLAEIKNTLEAIEGISEIHDLHVWNPSAESIALAAHVTVPDQMLGKVDELAEKVRTVLWQKFKIDHPTLQFESNACQNGGLLCNIAKNGNNHHRKTK